MSKFLLAAGVAALAMTAPALAARGGPGNGHGANQGQKSAERGGNAKGAAMKTERGRTQAFRGQGAAIKAEHARVDVRRDGNRAGLRTNEGVRIRDLNDDHHEFEPRFGLNGLGKGLINGCPPGLAAKNNGCLPPGQAKKLLGTPLAAAYSRRLLTGPYSNWYRDDDRYLYRMGDNYIYRIDRSNNLINALIPSVNRDFGYYPVGAMYPSDFNAYNVPYQYRSFYPDGGQFDYRYGNGAIYALDPQTQAIRSIAQLLAGDLGVGQALPSSYGVYNMPLQYRDRYPDSASNLYRYNDGYIYRADPTTQLITAVISAIV